MKRRHSLAGYFPRPAGVSIGPFLILVLAIAGVRAKAQAFTLLHTFSAQEFFANEDGAKPNPQLILAGTVLYGSTSTGGTNGNGTIFSVQTDGNGFKVLQTFPFNIGSSAGDIALASNTVYGTMNDGPTEGFTSGFGTLFSSDLNSGAFKVLHAFPAAAGDGRNPLGPLLISGQTIYGNATAGGSSSRVAAEGSGLIYSFDLTTGLLNLVHVFQPLLGSGTNSDGQVPAGNLLLAQNTLYGTASFGGSGGGGTVFSAHTDSTQFQVLHFFSANTGTNTDGSEPEGLVLGAGKLYGATRFGGTNFTGTIYSISTDGTGFHVLHMFGKETANSAHPITNFDGALPAHGAGHVLALSGDTLYGVTDLGGTNDSGTIFSVNTDGTGFTVLHTFAPMNSEGQNADGASSDGDLVVSGNTLYGTSANGGTNGTGVVFSLTLPAPAAVPRLTLTPPLPGTKSLTITWPDTLIGYILEMSADLTAAWQPFSGPVSDQAGQQTSQISAQTGTTFFRLRHL